MNTIKPFEFGRRSVSSQSEVGSFLTGTVRNAALPFGYVSLAIRFCLAWGAIQFIIYIAIDYALREDTNLAYTIFRIAPIVPIVTSVISSIVLFICLKKIKDTNSDYLNLKQGLFTGLVFGLSSAIIIAKTSYLPFHYNFGFENGFSLNGLKVILFQAISGVIISLILTFTKK